MAAATYEGKPCKSGHTERYVSNNKCVECFRQYYEANKEREAERNRQYREANKERIRQYYEANKERKRQYYEANKERIRQYREANKERIRQYYEANKEREAERKRQYYEANKERKAERNRQWREANPEKVRTHNRNRRARKRNAEGTHTAADIRQLYESQRGRCAACTKKFTKKGGYHADHIVPLANGGDNSKYNIQLLCPKCNLSKSTKPATEFMQQAFGKLL